MRSSSVLLPLLILALQAKAAAAQNLLPEPETFFLNGFGTLGGTHSSSGDATFIRDKTQPDGPRRDGISWETDSRVGIQGRWKPRDDFEAMLQIVSKYRYDGSYRPMVTWGFLKYAFTPSLELRIGRLGFDIYFNGESSDVGYAYLWVRPPVEYYAPIYYTHYDGLDLSVSHPVGDGILRAKVFGGFTNESIASSTDADYQLNGDMWGGLIEYQLPNWLFRAGFDVIKLHDNYESLEPLLAFLRRTGIPQAVTIADELRLNRGQYIYLAAGASYENGPWRSQFGISQIDTDNLLFPRTVSATLTLGYRIGRWTPYAVYSRVASEHPEVGTGLPDIEPYSTVNDYVDRAVSYTQTDQSTFSLGARYDVSANAALKMQVDWVHSRDNPSLLWLDPDADWNGRSTVFSLTLDFVF